PQPGQEERLEWQSLRCPPIQSALPGQKAACASRQWPAPSPPCASWFRRSEAPRRVHRSAYPVWVCSLSRPPVAAHWQIAPLSPLSHPFLPLLPPPRTRGPQLPRFALHPSPRFAAPRPAHRQCPRLHAHRARAASARRRPATVVSGTKWNPPIESLRLPTLWPLRLLTNPCFSAATKSTALPASSPAKSH